MHTPGPHQPEMMLAMVRCLGRTTLVMVIGVFFAAADVYRYLTDAAERLSSALTTQNWTRPRGLLWSCRVPDCTSLRNTT